MNESGPQKKQGLPKELNELYGFFTLSTLNESSLYHEYEGDALNYINNIPDVSQKKALLEKLNKIPKENFTKEGEFEGFYNFCTSLKNLLESELKGNK